MTGLIFGLFVLPGYVVDSFETATLYPFYVTQLVVFSVFITFVFNATKGNLLIYIFTFWLLATGSQINLYFFNPQVQIMQIIFFALACAVIYYLVKKEKISTELQTFPEFIG
ncbi:MAG TPA: hypothetical protein DEQ02_10570 [Ruminococcaceae bacterium]|nr:hypothetical protein [Oscillospiraceae bacterium]